MSDQTLIPVWTLGERLHKARTIAGVSVEDMATDIGRTDRTIRNYENDSTVAPLLVIRQYAARTGVPFDWLSGGDLTPKLTITECYSGLSARSDAAMAPAA